MGSKKFVTELIMSLREIFQKDNAINNKYSQAWLSEVDFGGLLYRENLFVVNVKIEPHVESRSVELKYIIMELFKDLPQQQNNAIWRVSVHAAKESIECEYDDRLIFSND